MWNRHSALNDFGNCAAPLALGLYFGTFDLGRCPRLVWAGPLARVTLCAGRTTPVHVKKLQTSQRCNREELALLKRAAQIVVMLPDEQATPEQVALLRRMTPERRLSLAEQLYWSARELKAAWLRSRHADWAEEQIGREVRRLFTNARS